MKPPTVFLGEMTSPEVEAFLRRPRHGHRADRLDRAARPARPAADRRRSSRTRSPAASRRGSAPSSRRRSTTALSYPHVGFTGRRPHPDPDVHGAHRGPVRSRSRRSASGGSCSSTATTTTRTRSPTPARTRADACPPASRAFPVNYWDGMTADEAAEFFGPTNGPPREPGRDVGGHGDRRRPRRPGRGERRDAAVPRGHQRRPPSTRRSSSRRRARSTARRSRARGATRASRSAEFGERYLEVVDRGDGPDARRHRADVRGDAAALT